MFVCLLLNFRYFHPFSPPLSEVVYQNKVNLFLLLNYLNSSSRNQENFHLYIYLAEEHDLANEAENEANGSPQ